jgi:hypothetical protein
VLLSNIDEIEYLVKQLISSDEKYVIVTTREIARVLGRTVYRVFGRSDNIVIYVFKDNYPEEYALRIIVHNSPDNVFDCDPFNRFSYLKKLVEHMSINKYTCVE